MDLPLHKGGLSMDISVRLGPTGSGEILKFMTVYGFDAHSPTTRRCKATKTMQG